MTQTTRQTSLLVQQDWTKIYQTFTNADFTSYDFETLRNSMINYIKTYYPETFNDFLESSEYLALIDMIAFLGQSLAFRTDLNARENFIDTAQRRDSILKLARMLSYNPKRTTAASGLLKIDSVRTTESVTDSNGFNLANSTIHWNDLTNDNWLEQFTAVFNASLVTSQQFGKPGNSQKINGIQTDEYSVSLNPNTLPVAGFSVNIQGNPVTFEAVSATTVGQSYIYAEDPTKAGQFNLLYRNDNNGNGSNNTGFFVYFKQGTLNASSFNVTNAVPNNFVPITNNHITDTDHWLYALDVNNNPVTKWTPVPALPGVNVVFNNLTEKNLYQINTLNNDQVNLVFGDGSFANIPQGNFKFFYRTSNGTTYSVGPDDMSSVSIAFSYIGKNNNVETLTITASLKYTVTNANAAPSLSSIKSAAPQQYYTQNRMVTAEDYNIFPGTSFTSIQKIKAVNRSSSGVSLYLDAIDPTGTYSSTNIFGDDGVITANSATSSTKFSFLTTNDIYSAIYNQVIPTINSTEVRNYYYGTYPRYATPAEFLTTPTGNLAFVANTTSTTTSSGYLKQSGTLLGTANSTSYITNLSNLSSLGLSAGFTVTGNGVPANTTITQIVSAGNTIILSANATINATTTLTYFASNVSAVGTATTSNLKYVAVGASLLFTAPNGKYFDKDHNLKNDPMPVAGDNTRSFYATVTGVLANTDAYTPNRITFGTYVPESAILFDTDALRRKTIMPAYKNDLSQDLIATLIRQIQTKSNFGLTYDQVNQVWSNIKPADIESSTDWVLKFKYNQGLYTIDYRTIIYVFGSVGKTNFYFDPTSKAYDSTKGLSVADIINILKINNKPSSYDKLGKDIAWQVYNTVTQSDGYVDQKQILVKSSENQMMNVPDDLDLYTEVAGTNATRSDLYFQYKHHSPSRSRIDPTPVNLIDLYILTSAYTTSYINYLRDLTGTVTMPTPPTSSSLQIAYSTLDNYKAVSDTIIYNPAQFKPLFGAKADPTLQARFQVVKNPSAGVTDNEIKSQVINAVNNYFDPINWDFGDTFYFSELAAYLHTILAPAIASIVIVPASNNLVFGNYFQINAEPWEIITSAATVNDVDVVTAVTAAHLNLGNNLVGGFD
jgi:hypothetical protein